MPRSAAGRAGPLLLALVLSLVLAAGAQAGQIVFDHGSEIWVMNEDGSGAKPLITAGQVPGMSEIGNPRVFPDGGTAVAFEATTNANQSPVGSGPAGACGIQCTGIYTLSGGALARITGAPAPCGPTPQWCASFSTEPDWTADGKIAYEYTQYTWEYGCFNYICSWQFTTALEEIHTTAATAGSGPGPAWPVQKSGLSDNLAPVTDPADATKIAYLGASECNPNCSEPIEISTGSGTDTPVAVDDNLVAASWSPDGSTIADVEGGGERGIWTYAADAATTPGKQFIWALEDPIQTGHDPGNNPYDVSFSDPAWIGNGKILFAAEHNLWTIPASCGTGGTPCHFPQDATELTTDGSAASPDDHGDWTSASTPLVAPGGGAGGGGGGKQGKPPSASDEGLAGLAGGKAKLHFDLNGGSAGPLSKIVVKLPAGISFTRSAKKLKKGIVLRANGKKVKFGAKLGGGKLILTPTPPQAELQIAIGPPATVVSSHLAGLARRHKVKRLTVTVTATGPGGSSTIQLHLAPH